jgi:hypothetical protein
MALRPTANSRLRRRQLRNISKHAGLMQWYPRKPKEKQQVPPQRYAPVGMTLLFKVRLCVSLMNCHPRPERVSSVVGGGGHATSSAGPVGVEEFASRLVDAFIGVRAKEVALRLE